MTGITTLKALTLMTKLYTGYAYSLAFIFQSSLVLIMAGIATLGYALLKQHSYLQPNNISYRRKMINCNTTGSPQ
ncbi:hypothetical protein ACMXYN_13775 [Neptuniibacter sp. PT8_73]|uniref:hypothetical protein n=1 Tax=unclassified Neptuniibacter TaxID=2630693 RepID=UPI0039F720F1